MKELNVDAEINKELEIFSSAFEDSNIYSAIFSEAVCVVSKYPTKVHRNGNNDLHNTSGPAVEWNSYSPNTNFDCYYINGRSLPRWIWDKKDTLTKEDFIKEDNEDIKAGIYEVIESKGEGSMLTFLEAKEVHKCNITHLENVYDGKDVVGVKEVTEEMVLYKTRERFKEEEDLNGNSNVPLAWLKMNCASTGTTYLIPSDSSFNDCIEAAKYHRPSLVPGEIKYQWNSRS